MRKLFVAAIFLFAGQFTMSPANASIITFTANLTGSQEVPPTISTATGFGTVLLDDVLMQITVNESWQGLTTGATASHIHQPAAVGATAPVVFPFNLGTGAGMTSGAIPEQTFAITAAQIADMEAGLAYMNVHTTNFPSGEIRGQLLQATPEPGTLACMGLGWLGLAVFARRRRG